MKYFLFTTADCPKCPEVKEFIQNNITFTGEIIKETDSRFQTLIQTYDIKIAPTLIVLDNKEIVIFSGSEIPEIQDFLSNI